MTKIVRGGETGSLDNLNSSQATFRTQITALTDAVRQLGGSAEIGSGAVVNDPLSAPYVFYVSPYTGSDKFVGGNYSTSGTALQRIELQRLECGYTEARPFKTINRAIIEAGIVTAKNYYESPLTNQDLISIVLLPGAQTVLNGPGANSVSEWATTTNPTNAQLEEFNPSTTGGILLPRGMSLCGLDLRKTIIRPGTIPGVADELADCSNRRAIFKVTGTGYFFGFTFMDKVGSTTSHHLLHCFEFASKNELDEFYGKIRAAFGGANNTGGISNGLAVTRSAEYEIVGPQPAGGSQTVDTDTTLSASPYIFNCSIRSNLGLSGVFADGAKTSGFRSLVIAQLTGVSLQRDIACWQKFDGNQSPRWGSYFTDYADYINTDPDNVRMNPLRRSFHIRARNNAVIQEVSVFAIGQGIHHWCESGSDVTITNSNSNFGGCAALAEGYKTAAFQADSGWNVGRFRVASNLADKQNNIRKIYIGVISNATANNATTITLTQNLEVGRINSAVPRILDREGYSLAQNSYIWVENSRGKDYRVQLPSTPWSSNTPNTITVSGIFQNEDGIKPGDDIINSQGYDTGQNWPSLAGARIYARRLQDVRTSDERRFSLRCNNTVAGARTPVRDYTLQTTPGNNGVVSLIPESGNLTVSFSSSISPQGAGVLNSANVELRRSNAFNSWTSNALYRPGDIVSTDGKHYSCILTNSDSSFISDNWEEAYVHMEDAYNAEDYWKNTQPTIIFDKDTDAADASTTCGYNLSTVWANDAAIQKQYRSASDYRGLYSFLMSLGFSSANAHTLLLPRGLTDRERDPASALDGIAAPSGAATTWNNWAIEFRRPSNIRLFGHAYEWTGYLNYTKAIPAYQKELGALNKFTYYFTNKNGGRVYGSGFNEEGFIVTPKGLQDLVTGTDIAFESIADADIPIDELSFPTFYDALSVNTLNVNTQLNLSGTVSGTPTWEGGYGNVLPELPVASTTQRGLVEIATASEVQEFLRDDLAVTPSTLIQALGDAIKSVVNLRLSLSGSSAVPSSNQLNSTNIYVHPNNGNELALYSTASLRWQVVRFNGIQTFSLASANTANTVYDIYIYNSGTALAPTLAIEYVAWQNDTTPPTRAAQDGVLVRYNNPGHRLIGVVRTTSAGTSTIDLGGVITGSTSADFPKIYLANLFNLYTARAVYFFGSAWNVPTNTSGWSPAPASVYASAPRVSWVQASDTNVLAFLDIYNNTLAGGNTVKDGAIVYVAPGIDTYSSPPTDAFYGEVNYDNSTGGSQWSRALSAGKHDIYYLYQQFAAYGNANTVVNEHPAHGMIVTVST